MQSNQPANTDTNYKAVKEAWQLFVETGVVDYDVLRPEIAESWIRFFKYQQSDEAAEPLPADQLKIKQDHNRRLIEVSKSVMHDIDEILANLSAAYVVALFDSEGDIIDLLERGNDIIQLGHRCSEIHAGTNAPALALKKGQLAEVSGYEHLLKKYGKTWETQGAQWYSIGAAIFNFDQSIAGVLGVVNMTGRIPAIKPMVSLGTRLIEAGIIREQTTKHNLPIILNTRPQIAVATDDHGKIFCANQKFLDFIQAGDNDIAGHYLGDYLSGQLDMAILFSASDKTSSFDNVTIKKPGHNPILPAHIFKVNKVVSGDDNNLNIIVLIFEDKSLDNTRRDISHEKLQTAPPVTFKELIGESPIFAEVKKTAQKAARSAFNVLIDGESGTGKEVVAQAIHNESHPRGPFVAVNCGAIPKDLLQSELFGYEEGAFTGARKGGSIGKCELADGGTLFLDEIGEMPLEMQVSLLRFLQDKVVTPVGGGRSKKVNVRIIAATNRNLYSEVRNGNFREDLYYRLNVIPIHIPPLRERLEDVPLLAKFMLKNLSQQLGIDEIEIDQTVLTRLGSYKWPGNVRELQNVLERALVYTDGQVITADSLPPFIRESNIKKPTSSGANLKSYEKDIIIEVLKKHKGNISKTALELGITRTTLYKKMDEFGIQRDHQ